MKRTAIMIITLLAAALLAVPAFASEGLPAAVEIPVENCSAAGSFAVFEGERVLDEIHLAQGASGVLELSLESLDHFVFRVRRTSFDGPGKDAGGQYYTVHVMTYLEDGKVQWSSYAEEEGKEGKAGKIAFYPAADPQPTDTPQTGDGSWILYICLAALAAASGAGLVFGRARMKGE